MSKEKDKEKPGLSTNLFPVVGIGASAGGIDAFKRLLKAIPANSGMAYVLVQHLDPHHESMLPELLQKVTDLPVEEIKDEIEVQPDHIYIIPSNKMVIAIDGILLLTPRPPKNKNALNLPVDVFFKSLAEEHQSEAVGVVLSGTASDGTKGLKAIKDHGGITFAQNIESAQYEGMPESAANAGVVDFILTPEEIPHKIIEVMGRISRNEDDTGNSLMNDEEVFKQILSLLRIRKGTDFTYYKQTTIRRRILRRMALNKNNEPAAYFKFLREHKPEQDILYQDLLIPVTGFFRDSKSFDNLYKTVFPQILQHKLPGEALRVWVAGCSTGEEAFSIAISLKEFLSAQVYSLTKGGAKSINEPRVQIFATDISETAIAKARRGIYSKQELDGLSQQRLQEHFAKFNGSYQVNKAVRDMCIFAVHNFLKDPPFAKIDLVSCRNVLIYMEPYLQKKAFTTFHYVLRPKGFLFLGRSETCGSVPDLFTAVGKSEKVFCRKDVPSRYIHVAGKIRQQKFLENDMNNKNEGKLPDFQKTADDVLLSKFAPAGVVVNEAMEIVHFRGATAPYLEPAPGKASFNLLKMIKEGLAFELRNILYKAKTAKETFLKENIPVEIKGEQRQITIEVIPLQNVVEPHYLVLFHDNHFTTPYQIPVPVADDKSSKKRLDAKDLRIQQLEQELRQTRKDMRAITEDQEAANEELQSANEELLSGSEELQSLNEELETSKEELQITNEELLVINQEITNLNEQVTEARNYAESIITTIREPLIILDRKLRVKSANQSFYKTFMVNESATKGKLLFQLGNGQWDIPELKSRLERIIPENERFSDYEVRWVFPNIGERTMLLNAREMKEEVGAEKLILLAIEDITEKRLSENRLLESERKFRTMADFIPQMIWTAGPDGKIDYFNKQWYAFTGLDEQRKSPNWLALVHENERQQCTSTWRMNIDKGEHFEMECQLKENEGGTYRWFLMKAAPIKNESGLVTKWFGTFTGIHEQKIAADEMLKAKEQAESAARTAEEAVQSKQQFLSNMSHEIRTPVNSIIGFIKVLLRTELTEKQAEYANAIKLSGDVLITLINDILDLAKVDAGKMTFEKIPFRLPDTLSSILNLFELDMQEKNIELEKHFDPLIPKILRGDPVRLQQIILNLMNNAVKFTDSGKITIEVRMLKEDKGKVDIEFSIADTGVGIPEDKLNLIFDNFQQAYTEIGVRPAGTGLGLSIVKKLIEAQGGTINVKSKLKEGSVFTFILAFQKTKKMLPSERKEQYRLEAEVPNIRVLIVEDAPLNQVLMTTLMTDFGFKLDVVENGKMAIEKLTQDLNNKDDHYDIIMMDLQMPEMNGFEATSYIRNQLHLDIPIIAITADVTHEAIEKSIAVGMNDYIPKPVDEKLLFEKILNLLNIPLNYRKATGNADKSFNNKEIQTQHHRYTNLSYLKQRTRSDPKTIKEMISIYLDQTPLLLSAMKESVVNKDWDLLHAAAHKILPSFSIMGFDEQYQTMVKKIQQYDGNTDQFENIKETISKIEAACRQAFTELQGELAALNIQ